MNTHSKPPPILDPTLTPPYITLILLLPPLYLLLQRIRKDYHAFLALGPGGTPATPTGYLRICILRLFALRNPLTPPPLPRLSAGCLHADTLPRRRGPRPTVAGIAPHRQTTQKGSRAMYQALTAAMHDLTRRHPDLLYSDTSCFEKHSTGIFSRRVAASTPRATAAGVHHRTCNGEVCHSHPSDGSLHLTLHPADVALLLERGWGQRHPLAREDWWWGVVRTVPPGFVMVYAPRDAEELACVMEIVRAAVWWVSDQELASGESMPGVGVGGSGK
ncbi:conserved hypothetical protein [Aspergillus terreus NIH2624]|uniref:Luciferase domain-containing protein n=1 Tax=Aspergillus terreus (strain NIH 2624 / FGSC A1156) TaxID=341663 RepID=Q0D121_ASPTN|nr:uncharacterized protein ATEG_00363 [Aspergillus terreus NIH2624]EAU39009.1 conserved hypothetical protein [Aspergillus terreus NIH2624]